MNFSKCMLRECRNCKNELICFKEFNEYKNTRFKNKKDKINRKLKDKK